ncbi:MAG: class I mannose-6-phosphate isomerase [Verrucomicrobiales bacterium]|nr:class I mannose-6-phosphate isomerase [Verrucomicrobiales bacterium]
MNAHRGKILRLPPNRVWRTYSGGFMLDRMEGRTAPADGPFPEDWLGSTVRAINPDRDAKEEGLARVIFSGGEAVLADLVAADPEYFLGAAHVKRFGTNPMVLVKYLDSAVRLPFQVHPTVEFSRKHLNAESGKTEAYYILSTRPEVTEPFIYLGFQRPPGRQELRRMIVEQDITAMEQCFDKIPVKPGDVYVVPGGLPHAIGGGVLMVEVMEPTDFVARVEFNVAGRIIPESARFMGRGLDFCLDLFSFEPLPVSAVQARWRCQPRVFAESPGVRREALVDACVTDRFKVFRTVLTGNSPWQAMGFTILLVVDGACTVATPQEEIHLSRFDRILIPHGMTQLHLSPTEPTVLLECLPPENSKVYSDKVPGVPAS